MSAKRGRAWRRAQRARMIQHAKNSERVRWLRWNPNRPREEVQKDIHQYALRVFNHLAVCSCSMCCNVRSEGWLKEYDKLTLQEKRAYNSYIDQMKNLRLL